MTAPMSCQQFKVLVGANDDGFAHCPAHDDGTPSLHVKPGKNGTRRLFSFKCYAGCETDAILAKLDLTWADIYGTDHKAQAGGKRTKGDLGELVATYEYNGANGTPVFRVLRFEKAGKKTFVQERACKGGGWKRGRKAMEGCSRVLYRLGDVISAPAGSTVYFVEGEKCVAAVWALGLTATTTAGGAGNFDQTPAEHVREALAGKHVAILPDNDDPGRKYAQDVARCLRGHAASVRVLELPGLDRKGDVADWVKAGGAREELEQLSAGAPEWTPTDGVEIVIGTDEGRVVDEAIAALARDASLFERDAELVRVLDSLEGLPKIQRVPTAALRERLARAAAWLRKTQAEDETWSTKPAHLPDWCVREVEARASWPGLRRLSAVAVAPTMRLDGSILDTPGHDSASGIVYLPRAPFPKVATRPTADDVRRAVETLCDPLIDFPWAGPHDRASVLAAIMTIVCRAAIPGPVPLWLIRARAAATGKSLLGDTISIAATGRPPQLVPSPPADNNEWRKLLLSLALEGRAAVSFDNVEGDFGSPALAATLTTGAIHDRVLGTNETGGGEIRTVLLATGNNIGLRQTIARRTIVVELETDAENPEDRTGFRYENLRAHVAKIWPSLAVAALTIVRAYVVAGRPQHTKPRLGSYEAWDDLIRGSLIWAGAGDPDGARQRTRDEADTDRDALGAALAGWWRAFGDTPKTTAGACAAAEPAKVVDGGRVYTTGGDAELVAALAGICRGGKLNPRSLGYALRAARRKVVAGLRFDAKRGDTGLTWHAEQVAQPRARPCDASDPCDGYSHYAGEEREFTSDGNGWGKSHGSDVSHGDPAVEDHRTPPANGESGTNGKHSQPTGEPLWQRIMAAGHLVTGSGPPQIRWLSATPPEVRAELSELFRQHEAAVLEARTRWLAGPARKEGA